MAFASGGKSRGHVDAPFDPVRGKLKGDSLATGKAGSPPLLLGLMAVEVEPSATSVGSSCPSPSSCGFLGSSWQR